MKYSKQFYLLPMFFVLCSCCDFWNAGELTELPPETQTGAGTFGCYVNGELLVTRWGANITRPAGTLSTLDAEYATLPKILIISAYGKKGRVHFRILNPQEKEINTTFCVYCEFNGQKYSAHNLFAKYNLSLGEVRYIEGNHNIGQVYISKLDTINRIVSGSFDCKMGEYYESFEIADINTYVCDSIASLSQGRFDIKFLYVVRQ